MIRAKKARLRAFEVALNGKRLCVAGIGEAGVVNAMIDHVVNTTIDDVKGRVGASSFSASAA